MDKKYCFTISKKELKTLKKIVVLPFQLINKELACKKCFKNFIPDWLAIRQPCTPVIFANGRWGKCVSSDEKCPSCGSNVKVHFPDNVQLAGHAHLFIDEAVREHGDCQFVCYSAVRCNVDKFQALIDINRLIRSKIGEISGTTPVHELHTTELWRGNKNKSSLSYSNLTKEDVVNIIRYAMNLIKESSDIKVYCSIFPFTKPQDHKAKFEIVNTSLLQVALGETTASGLIPEIVFENDGRFGRILRLFKGMACSLAFPFITNGLPIAAPISINKTSRNELTKGTELSDLICFCVGRFYYKKMTSEICEFDIEELGEVAYILLDKNNDIRLSRGTGFQGF